MTSIDLGSIVRLFARALEDWDARAPQASSSRTGALYAPGVGPFAEAMTVATVAHEMARNLSIPVGTGVSYPSAARRKCDLVVDDWHMEVKLLRMLGDNGKPNDNMVMHLLSPYSVHRSALTDCAKLRDSGFRGRTAVLVYAFDYDDLPAEPALRAFEVLASDNGPMGGRVSATFKSPTHPIHSRGVVCGWEVL